MITSDHSSPKENAVSTVVSLILITTMLVLSFAIITVTVFAYTEDSAYNHIDANFQPSADHCYLYHTGGDTLPLSYLNCYDSDGNEVKIIATSDGDSYLTTGEWIHTEKPVSIITCIGENGDSELLYRCFETARVAPLGDMVPDHFPDRPETSGNIGSGKDEPKYTLTNLANWELLISELKQNIYNDTVCCRVSWNWNPETKKSDIINEVQMPTGVLLSSTNGETKSIYYIANGPSSSLKKSEAEADLPLEEYAKKNGKSNMILLNLSSVYTKENISNGNWLAPAPKKGSIYEYEKDGVCKIYIAIQNAWSSGTNPENTSLWRCIGHRNSEGSVV